MANVTSCWSRSAVSDMFFVLNIVLSFFFWVVVLKDSMLYGDLLRYSLHFFTDAQLGKCSTVCHDWHAKCARILNHRMRAQKLIKERIRMTCEDERRFHEATHSHLQSLVQEWIDFSRGHYTVVASSSRTQKGCYCRCERLYGCMEPRRHRRLAHRIPHEAIHCSHAAIHRRNGRYGTARVDTTIMYHVRFLGWTSKWDEFVTCDRISGLGTRTYHYPNNYVHASRQWSLCCIRGRWDVRLVHPYAVASLTNILPLD